MGGDGVNRDHMTRTRWQAASMRAWRATSNMAASEAFLRAFRESGSASTSGRAIVVNIGGTVVEAGDIAKWIMRALGKGKPPETGAAA